MDFSKFDKQVDTKQLQKDTEEAVKNGGTGEYPEIPNGKYIAKIENMELGSTKDNRPMFKIQFRLIEESENNDNLDVEKFFKNWKGKKKPCVFMNRVVYGTKNDANMIASVIGFLNKLESEISPISFESYSQFNDLILDIMDDIDGNLEYEIDYDKDAFNSVSILEAYEVD